MKRLITASILIPVFFYVVVLAPHWLFMLVLVYLGSVCFYEFAGIAEASVPGALRLQRHPVPYVAGLVVLFLPAEQFTFVMLIALAAMVLALRSADLSKTLPVAGAMLLGILYTWGAWRFSAQLRLIDPLWLLFALAINWVGDSFAFYAGSTFGRHKMAPRVSPGKSWEGSAASLAGVLVVGAFALRWRFPEMPLVAGLTLLAAGNIAGQLGDLAESGLKRGAGMKDSGNSLPGHGGWLDRVDSSLFSVPVVYALLQLRWFQPPSQP